MHAQRDLSQMTSAQQTNFLVSNSLSSKNIHSISTISFTDKNDLNVVCIKGTNTLCIYLVNEVDLLASNKGKSLKPINKNLYLVLKAPIQGIVVSMTPVRLKNKDLDSLLILTAKNQLTCLSWDTALNTLKTEGVGNIREISAKACKQVSVKSSAFYYSPILSLASTPAAANETGKMKRKQKTFPVIGVHQYQGLLKIVPTSASGFGETFNVRLEALDVLDWIWLEPTKTSSAPSSPILQQQPESYTIAVLHQDAHESKMIETFSLSMKNKELTRTNDFNKKVDDSALFLIPISMGGFILVAENYFEYINPSNPSMNCSITCRPVFYTTYCMIDESRYLITDASGILYILVLTSTPTIYLSSLGVTCLASSLAYVQDGYVFVGSTYGDSMFVQLLDQEEARFYRPEERLPPPPSFIDQDVGESSVRLVQTFPAMGPISDFCVVERHGQGVVVACCGAYKDSTLRVIRNGIGMHVYASGGEENCLKVCTVTMRGGRCLVVVCMIDETRVGSVVQEGSEQKVVESTDDFGLKLDCTTLSVFLLCKSEFMVQVSHDFVRVVSAESLEKVSEWRLDGGDFSNGQETLLGEISECCLLDDDSSLVISVGANVILLSLASNGVFSIEKSYELADSISSMAFSSNAQIILASTWSSPPSVTIIGLSDFKVQKTVEIPSAYLVHTLLAQEFDKQEYILASMGDGDLYYFTVTPRTLETSSLKKTSLGTRPASLLPFVNNNQQNVFACSDRPAIIYHRANKLLFSSVNLRSVASIAPFPPLKDSLILATDEGLVIGGMEVVQKLHVKSVPVGETCRRIAEWGEEWFAVVTSATVLEGGSATNRVCLFDASTFEVADRYELREYEQAASLLVARLSDDSTPYLFVGTGVSNSKYVEAQTGRILVFTISTTQARKLELVGEIEVSGCAYSMVTLHGKLIAGVNAKVMVFDWSAEEKSLSLECKHLGYIVALYLVTRGDLIIVGDLMKSVSCLFYDPASKTMTLHARDFDTHWMTSVETLSSQVILGADEHMNLFTLQKDPDSKAMVMGSRFHLGETVNRFRRGSLVMKAGDSPLIAKPTLLFCTVSGSIGVISTLDDETFTFLDSLQNEMRKLESVGMLSALEFRTYDTDRAKFLSSGVIDGDLVESFADLAREVKKEICSSLGKSVEEVSNIIQELTRLH